MDDINNMRYAIDTYIYVRIHSNPQNSTRFAIIKPEIKSIFLITNEIAILKNIIEVYYTASLSTEIYFANLIDVNVNESR